MLAQCAADRQLEGAAGTLKDEPGVQHDLIKSERKSGEKKGENLLGASRATPQENHQGKSSTGSDQPCSKPMEEYRELSLVNSIASAPVKA